MSGLNRSPARKTVAAARRFRWCTFLALGGAAVAAGGVGIIAVPSSREPAWIAALRQQYAGMYRAALQAG